MECTLTVCCGIPWDLPGEDRFLWGEARKFQACIILNRSDVKEGEDGENSMYMYGNN